MDFVADSDSWIDVFANGPVCIVKYRHIIGEWPVIDATVNIEELTGWTEKEFTSGIVTLGSIIHPDDRERINKEEERWVEEDYSYNGISNYRIVSKSGEVHHVCEYAQGVFDKDGAPEFIVGYILDVAAVRDKEIERKNMEVEFARTLMDEAVGAMAQGLIICDEKSILHANSRVGELLDVPSDYFAAGRTWSNYLQFLVERGDFGDETTLDEIVSLIKSKITENGSSSSNRTIANGSVLREDVLPRENGGLVMTYTDITKNYQREIELDNARRAALNADRAKSEFLANMSHEIRTPMNGVMGMAELLGNTELDTKQRMFTDVIVKSGSSLLTIINDILDFSKLDAGQMELGMAPFILSEAIEDVAILVSARVAEKNLELIVRIDPELPGMFVGDVGRIRQIVTNLLSNAVKFTERGHVYVNVSPCEMCATDKSGIRVAIQDTGIGIDPDSRTHVFEKFSQIDGSATRKNEGTGLGLSICKSLINLMEGNIGVDCKPGEGSNFWFEIALEEHQGAIKKPTPVDLEGSRILVVDDNSINRSILAEQFASWKFDCATAACGEDALNVLGQLSNHGLSVDCMILDYQMPDMNGGDVVRSMKADPDLANIPVLMLTSVESTDDGETFSSLGIQGFLTKPARSSALFEMLQEILHAKGEPTECDGAAVAKPVASSLRKSGTVADVAIEMPSPKTGQLDILVCEDNEVNQMVFTQILEGLGMKFRIANNGKEGVKLHEECNPSVIVMDVSMPLMNGLEATKAIREREVATGAHTPIIGVTAHALKGDMETCFDAGMDDYLSKPVSPGALGDKLKKWLNRPGIALSA